jgi:oligo-1,6-glucosidase
LRDLGVDIIWLSPMYPSPLADEGYDISDYYGVDARFGTLEDMDGLICESAKRGMKIILDLVVNHCSDEHPWFQDVLRDPTGSAYKDFFYIADGPRPTNWRSYFGGSAWSPLGESGKSYLHLFHKKQPDLNWECPALRKAVIDNVRWWLERGVAGFRLDAIINIKKALPLRDYPADDADGLCGVGAMLAEAKGIGAFLCELRDAGFAPYDAFTVGEVFNVDKGAIGEWIGKDGYLSTMFDFSGTLFGGHDIWHAKRRITPEDYKECVFSAQEAAGEAFLSNII